ncbi:hypothetical protein ACFL59_16040, partial [Planctomycetota bacterium]
MSRPWSPPVRGVAVALVALVVTLVTPWNVRGEDHASAPDVPRVLRVTVDFPSVGLMTIDGAELGDGVTAPGVVLGDTELEVASFTPAQIVTVLPDDLLSGTYLLTVRRCPDAGVPGHVHHCRCPVHGHLCRLRRCRVHNRRCHFPLLAWRFHNRRCRFFHHYRLPIRWSVASAGSADDPVVHLYTQLGFDPDESSCRDGHGDDGLGWGDQHACDCYADSGHRCDQHGEEADGEVQMGWRLRFHL